jgi:acetylornithine deacetylase/succinyl-diaminopimelate desuccinylase-like protein
MPVRMKRMIRGAAVLGTILWLGPMAAAGTAAAAAQVDWDAVSEEAATILRRYIRFPSVNPPADTRQTAAFLKEILEGEGIEVRTFESSPGKVNVLARLPASGPAAHRPLLLLHHMDVVPVDAARWPVEPFSGEMKDGMIYGRGSADMKGPGVIHLLALLTLKRQQVPLARDVLLLATADEESGGHGGARWMLEHHAGALDAEYVLDEGGFGARDLMAADGRVVFPISVGEKKMLWVKVAATGTAGHGSQPTPDNPNDRLARRLHDVLGRAATLAPRGNPTVEELRRRVGGLADNKFTRAIQRDTVSLTTLRSGVGDPPKPNVIPSVAEATFDCRLMPDTDSSRFLSEIVGADDEAGGLRTEVLYRMDDTPVTPHDTPLFAALEKAIRQEHPGAVVAPSIVPYGTDSNAFRVKGAKAYGIVPVVVDAAIIASMHSDAERIPASELGRGVRILYTAVKAVSEKSLD